MEEPKPRRSRIIIRKTKKQSENSFKNFTPSKDVNVNQSKYLYTNFIDVPNLNDREHYYDILDFSILTKNDGINNKRMTAKKHRNPKWRNGKKK